MKRYFFHIEEAVDFILECMTNIQQGTVFIPKMKSYKIKELADKVSKKQKQTNLKRCGIYSTQRDLSIYAKKKKKSFEKNRKNVVVLWKSDKKTKIRLFGGKIFNILTSTELLQHKSFFLYYNFP